MFQRKIDETFKGLPNAFSFADDILVVGYDNKEVNAQYTMQNITNMHKAEPST